MHFNNTRYIGKNLPQTDIDAYFGIMQNRFNHAIETEQVKYIDLGVKTIKIVNKMPQLNKFIEKHFGYTLKNHADCYDSTFYIWHDDILTFMDDRVKKAESVFLSSAKGDDIKLFINEKVLRAYNFNLNTVFICDSGNLIQNLASFGHLFVHLINKIAATPNSTLVHGAVVGVDDKGVLICAKGGKGKSTLSLSTILEGMQYVADDYLILEKADRLYARPIYSIATLSPPMFKNLSALKLEYLYLNHDQSKYVLSLAGHHNSFVKKLPVKALLFPKICATNTPTIEPAKKGPAIIQLVFSTATQMETKNSPDCMRRLMSFLQDLDCYQINLSNNIMANAKLLKEFIKNRI